MIERKIISATYSDVCNICELQSVKNGSGITKQSWIVAHENVPCALSQEKNSVPQQADSNNLSNLYTLFIDDLIGVKAGSKVICRNCEFVSGKPFVYAGSHQEIPLKFEDKA